MRILLTFDTGYAPHAAVVMESIIDHCPQKLDFVVMHTEDLDEECMNMLRKHFCTQVNSLFFYLVPSMELNMKSDKYLSHIKNYQSAFLRLFCERLPFDDLVLYLDCDTLIFDDVFKILDVADTSKAVCAVTEYNPNYKLRDLSHLDVLEKRIGDSWIYECYFYRAYKDLGMDFTKKYFCSGVMLINLNVWRQNEITIKALNYLRGNFNKCFSLDQDVLNHVLNGDYGELPPRWNDIVKEGAIFTNYSMEELGVARANPAVVHCAGSIKPWHYMSREKYRKMYRLYRVRTPWNNIEYSDKTFLNLLRKKMLPPFKAIIRKICGRNITEIIRLFACKKNNVFWAKSRI